MTVLKSITTNCRQCFVVSGHSVTAENDAYPQRSKTPNTIRTWERTNINARQHTACDPFSNKNYAHVAHCLEHMG
jgi:hypothetical protein